MKQIVAIHGWCSDSTYWNNWKDYFESEGWLWKNVERGYGYIEESEPYWEKNSSSSLLEQKVIFCHSLGIHLVSNKLLEEATTIILLNTFSRFIPKSKESRSIKIALYGMQSHLGKPTEEAMLAKFSKKASYPYPLPSSPQDPCKKQSISSKGREKLKADLDLLINTNGLPNGITKQAHVLVIHGKEDQIVSTSTNQLLIDDLTKYLETPPVSWIIKEEGHFIRCQSLIHKVNNWLRLK